MEPRHDLGKARIKQALAVFFEAVGFHYVFDGAALLGDFQLAVAVGAFESDVLIGEQGMFLLIIEAQFFREDQRATGH